jgi:hypothetical protein
MSSVSKSLFKVSSIETNSDNEARRKASLRRVALAASANRTSDVPQAYQQNLRAARKRAEVSGNASIAFSVLFGKQTKISRESAYVNKERSSNLDHLPTRISRITLASICVRDQHLASWKRLLEKHAIAPSAARLC